MNNIILSGHWEKINGVRLDFLACLKLWKLPPEIIAVFLLEI